MNERRADCELLRAFARAGDQKALADVVRRHLDLVFATAMRKVADEGAAEEISQNVFSALARKAWQFAPDDSLPAWLHKTALLESKSWLRGEMRRRRREQTAAELGTTMKTPADQPAFNALVPLLDEALLSLREKDRAALLLRYYESQSLREVGASLGVGEDAAQKRVQTALEKLSQFFQRRGFKTASVAVTATALQHTAASASVSTATLVVNAALQSAPPVFVGAGALIGRLAGLTKVQTAALCLAVAALPVAWQWNEARSAESEAARIQTQLADARAEHITQHTEIERLRETSVDLDASLATATDLTRQRADAAQKFDTWKNRLRGLLTADDYRWPDDSPFVRIPKSVLPQLNVHQPISPPGVLKQQARELLGLTPQEREQVEGALHRHFAAMDQLIEASIYETNTPSRISLPKTALASKVLVLPALGDEAGASEAELRASLKNTLGDERWQMMQAELKVIGVNSTRNVLNLDAAKEWQEVAAWVRRDENGVLVAGYGWGNKTCSFSESGLGLGLFLAGSDSRPSVNGMVEAPPRHLIANNLPEAVTRRILDWIQQEVAKRAGKEIAR